MKQWIIEEYGWDLTDDELRQGCRWHKERYWYEVQFYLRTRAMDDPSYALVLIFSDLYSHDLVPLC